MKKTIAILLLTIYLFNLVGYSLVFQYFINGTDAVINQSADHNTYNDKELVEVKVPLNMPYITATENYESVNGEVELNGIHYNYIKRKITSDTLYILCLPNLSKTNLIAAKADMANRNSDASNGGKKNSESAIKKLNTANNYTKILPGFNFNSQMFLQITNDNFIASATTSVYIKSPGQPPDFNC